MSHDHSLDCQDILQRLNAYVDGELDQTMCLDLEAHLASCPECNILLNTLKKTIYLCQVDGEEVILPEDVRKRLLTRLGLDDDVNQE